MQRYHVALGSKRTTVSLDTILSDLLALKLGAEPQTPAAHKVVRSWLQNCLDRQNDPGRIRTSQWLQAEVVEALVAPDLAEAYTNWILTRIQ